MPTQDQILTALAPELASEPVEDRALFLEMAGSRTGVVFGDNRDQAVALLAAHLMTLRSRRGAGGPVTTEKEGDLSRTFGWSVATNPNSLNSTSYGQELINLRKGCIVGMRTTYDG